MRRVLLIAPLLLLAGGMIWVTGAGLDLRIATWAAGWQREFQTALAGTLRALRAGESGALAMMLGVCFAYGFFHAIGPGHGKLVIGGYGLGRAVPVLRLSVISLLSALGQAASAITLVGAGLLLLGWTRQQLTQVAETMMLPLSMIAIACVGIWLMVRGARRLWHLRAPARTHSHIHAGTDGACGCGHRHGPTPEDMSGSGSVREAAVLIASIALRPCSGAILLLVLTWYMNIFAAGIAGTVAMSLGTATLTVAVAVASTFARRTTVMSLGHGARARMALPILEVAAGMFIAVMSLQMIGAMP